MPVMDEPVVVVGAGPTGIACAIELGRRDLAAVCHDRGGILHSIQRFPEEMRWFSTRDLLDIAGVPFGTPDAHPTRLETLAYYRSVAERFGVRVLAESTIERVTARPGGGVEIDASGRRGARRWAAPAAILATGFFDNPRPLDVPGADRPHVRSRYVSAFPWHGRDVVVVGGRNSAAEAALDLYRHGARVTLVHRGEDLSPRVKYWIRPDLENRIRAGAIRALFRSRVVAIEAEAVRVATPTGEVVVPAEAVFALIGYQPDFALFERCGIRLEGDARVPAHDPETLESNVPNLYLAGAMLGGTEVGRIFIENSRQHATRIAEAIERRRKLVNA